MPVSESDFDLIGSRNHSVPGRRIGPPGPKSFNLDFREGTAQISGNSIGKRNQFNGDILTNSTSSIKSSFLGTPIRVHDNDSGLIPSTLFTPIPAFLVSFDPIWVELGILAAFTATLGTIGTISEAEGGLGFNPGTQNG